VDPEGGTTTEAAFPLTSFHHSPSGVSSGHVVPAFWGEDYFHLVPLVWSWDENVVVVPLGWKVHADHGVGLVWWGENYAHVPPVFWHWDDNTILLPLAWKVGEHRGVGPVWWGVDYTHVFPFFWRWPGHTLLFPLLYDVREKDGRDFRILWRLFRSWRSGNESVTECQPFFTHVSRPGLRRFSFLWRVFTREETEEGVSIRILFSPRIWLRRHRL